MDTFEVHYPIGFRAVQVHYPIGHVPVAVQLEGFTQLTLPSAGGQYLQRAPLVITAEGAAIVKGSVWALDSTNAPYFHMSDTSAGAGAGGIRLFVDVGSDDDVEAALRVVTTGNQVAEAYTGGTSSIPGSGPHVAAMRWDATTLYASLDGAESAGNAAIANQVTPGNNLRIGTHPSGGTRGLTYSNLQLAMFSSAVVVDAFDGLTLWQKYRNHADLVSMPRPELGVLKDTEVGTPYYRDILEPALNRGGAGADHMQPHDIVVVGMPGSGRLNGMDQISVTDYAHGKLQDMGTTVLTYAVHLTTASDVATTQGVILRDGVADNLGLGVFINGGNIRCAIYKPISGFYGTSLDITIPASTAVWVVCVFDLSGDTITSYVYDEAGNQLYTGTITHADYSLGTTDRAAYIGRTVSGGAFLGTHHEVLVFETSALNAAEATAISDGTDITAGGKLTRHYAGLATGIEDVADATALWYTGGAGAAVLAAHGAR